MKKLIPVVLLAFVVASIFSSCKSHERCPAYGEVEKTQNKGI